MKSSSVRESVRLEQYSDIFGADLHPKEYQLYPHPRDAESELLRRFRLLRGMGRATILVDGAFDVPQPNHEAYLRHCKVLGAEALLRSQGYDATSALISEVLRDSNDLHLTVTVDADERINRKKSNKLDKGGVGRPIYPWQARADRITGYVYELDGVVRRTADLVTVEGDPVHIDTPFESSLHMADFLSHHGLLDSMVIYGEHEETISEAEDLSINPLVVPSDGAYFYNPQTDQPYSSSALIKRAQGGSVLKSITSPLDR